MKEKLMAGRDQVAGHGPAHDAEADEADVGYDFAPGSGIS
jgi:hypothetical protein